MKGRLRYSGICLLLILTSACVWGREKAEWGISISTASLSPDDAYLAFQAGPLTPSGRAPLDAYSRLFILDFAANKLICCSDLVIYGSSLAWYPLNPPRLYVVEDRFTETDDVELIGGRLIGFEPAQNPVPIFARKFDPNDDLAGYAVRGLAWSPSGRTLSAITALPLTKLHLSFDGAESFVLTKNVGHLMSQRWADDKTLLVEQWVGGNDVQIAEIKIGLEGVESVQTIVESKPGLRLAGVLDSEAVYRTEHQVNIGRKILVQSEEHVGRVVVGGQYVAAVLVSDNNSREVAVYDRQGKMLGKWTMPNHASLLGLSARRQCVYRVECHPLRVRCLGFGDARNVLATWPIPRVDLPVSVVDRD